MIYTLTPSPSLDLEYCIGSSLQEGRSYRSKEENLRPGGRGINISLMLKNLGVDSTALGFVAGFFGDELMRLTAALGIRTGFIRVRRGRTRVNVKIRSGNAATSVKGPGPKISLDDVNYLLRKIKALQDDDILVLAGSVPPNVPRDFYSLFFEALKGRNTKIMADVPLLNLKEILKHRPFLVRPSIIDLEHEAGHGFDKVSDVLEAFSSLKEQGAEQILLSMGDEGTYFCCSDGSVCLIKSQRPIVTLDRSGAADALLAGFVCGLNAGSDLLQAAVLAVAAGSATAMTAGMAAQDEVFSIKEQMGDCISPVGNV